MRKNGYSQASHEFRDNLRRAEALLRIEIKTYKDPPPLNDQLYVESLRGAAAVLMVSALERYLKDSLEEYVSEIAAVAKSTAHTGLPDKIVFNNDVNYMTWLIRDNRLAKAQKLMELKNASKKISANDFIPEAFSRTRSNPGPDTLKTLLVDFGIQDPFQLIEYEFGKKSKLNIPKGHVESKLRRILERRNDVAHGGYALNISRKTLQEDFEFLKILVKTVDNVTRDHAIKIVVSL